ncbi:DUF2971 domain-containing protein [Shewanella cyperi]|uniref:DUF2971 domain-containing protein n=1 Tax=Shewanella cyperi TaxID=2814292 RepID=A0A975AKG0_9GAMM|nr:DUF2971 domain-containing protein [Shewanella cyperi]QSX29701.1 DUF2971 domain-containing protein [Shewanella cyperi]
MIYHYSDSSTLIKILESKVLWLSDILKMNDPGEYTAGFEIVKSVFKQKFPDHLDWLERNHFIGKDKKTLLLSCSFSKQKDDLGQWRAYGDDSKGVAIGFTPEIIKESNTIDIPMGLARGIEKRSSVLFHDVIYSQESLKSEAEKILGGFFFQSNMSFQNILNSDENILALNLSRLACLYKTEFYAREGEVRCMTEVNKNIEVHTEPNLKKHLAFNVKFRSGKYGITPYTELNLCNENGTSISEVILGPNNTERIEDIKFMLEVLGYARVNVSKSNGLYR